MADLFTPADEVLAEMPLPRFNREEANLFSRLERYEYVFGRVDADDEAPTFGLRVYFRLPGSETVLSRDLGQSHSSSDVNKDIGKVINDLKLKGDLPPEAAEWFKSKENTLELNLSRRYWAAVDRERNIAHALISISRYRWKQNVELYQYRTRNLLEGDDLLRLEVELGKNEIDSTTYLYLPT